MTEPLKEKNSRLKKKLHINSSRAPGLNPWAPLHFVWGALLEGVSLAATSKTFHWKEKKTRKMSKILQIQSTQKVLFNNPNLVHFPVRLMVTGTCMFVICLIAKKGAYYSWGIFPINFNYRSTEREHFSEASQNDLQPSWH